MDYNPYNRNETINNNDSSQLRQEKINQTKNWVFGNPMRDSLSKNENISNYNSYNQNKINPVENKKDNNILIPQKNQTINSTNQFSKNNSLPNNFRYLIYLPIQPPQIYPSLPRINQTLPLHNSQQIFQANKINNKSYPSLQTDLNDYSFFGSESKRKEEERIMRQSEYRDELLKQIEEKKRADEERKRKMKEEEKNELIKNEEYFKLKKLQADEQARKLREKIARRMQRQQAEEYGNSSNFLEISKDFENMNKSRQGASLVNNIELTNKHNSIETGNRNDFINYEGNYDNENYYDLINNNMILEQENYMKEIDNEYDELCQTIKFDIDQMINKYKTDIYLEIPNYEEKLTKKEKQYANYILGKTLSQPTPFKLDKNPLSNSYTQKQTEKSKTIDLEEFFNRDMEKYIYREKNYYNSKKNEIKNRINKDYLEIFENLNETKSYTKKYSNDKNQISHSESFISNKTHSSDNESKSNNETRNKFYMASYYNSTISNSMYDKEKNKNENDEDTALKIEDSSMRTTQNKNKSKTILDKQLINIKENKEDEEDEEDDEENKKLKEENVEENKDNGNNKDNNIDGNNEEDKENNLNEEKKGEEKEGEEREEEEDDDKEEDK